MTPSELARDLFQVQPPAESLAAGAAYLTTCLSEASGGTTASPGDVLDAEDPLELSALDGLWLIRITHPGIAHQPLPALLLQIRRILQAEIEDNPGHPARRLRDATSSATDLSQDTTLRLAVLLLSLGHHPLRFLPEIVGVTLARLELRALNSPKDLRTLLIEAATEAAMDKDRVHRGSALYRRNRIDLARQKTRPADPETHRSRLATRLASRLSTAAGYHGAVTIGSCPLSRIMSEAQQGDPEELLRSLEHSPFTQAQDPTASRLWQAFGAQGPMAGVLSPDDLHLLEAWLRAPDGWATPRSPRALGVPIPAAAPADFGSRPLVKSVRALYPALLKAQQPADCPDLALRLIETHLSRTRMLQRLGLARRPFPYQSRRFRDFVDRLHEKALKPKPPSSFRPQLGALEWRWLLLQLTPAILVDGAWLSGLEAPPGLRAPWQAALSRILEEELGAGEPQQNHPNVQRRLLEQLNLPLPDFRDPRFAESPCFLDSAFVLPAYLLALGRQAGRYTPEILGLNLAIELSGLGQGYPRVIRALDALGIDSEIVRLHLGIDNLATGHARWAVEAIEDYLDTLKGLAGESTRDQHWHRLFTGYQSLRVTLSGFGLALGARLLLKKTAIHGS